MEGRSPTSKPEELDNTSQNSGDQHAELDDDSDTNSQSSAYNEVCGLKPIGLKQDTTKPRTFDERRKDEPLPLLVSKRKNEITSEHEAQITKHFQEFRERHE